MKKKKKNKSPKQKQSKKKTIKKNNKKTHPSSQNRLPIYPLPVFPGDHCCESIRFLFFFFLFGRLFFFWWVATTFHLGYELTKMIDCFFGFLFFFFFLLGTFRSLCFKGNQRGALSPSPFSSLLPFPPFIFIYIKWSTLTIFLVTSLLNALLSPLIKSQFDNFERIHWQ